MNFAFAQLIASDLEKMVSFYELAMG